MNRYQNAEPRSSRKVEKPVWYTVCMNSDIRALSDAVLVQQLKACVSSERDALGEVVRYLHEIDVRKLYLSLGYSSLFSFCTQGLGYSEGAAFRRIRAARCVEEHPEILEKLRSGALSLCAISELSKVEPEKRASLMSVSEGKSKAVVRELVEKAAPVVAKRVVEKVRVSTVAAPAAPLFQHQGEEIPAREEQYTVTLTLSREEYELLKDVQMVSGERMKSRAVVKALRLYSKVKSPKERARRRDARRVKAQAKKVTATVKVDGEVNGGPEERPRATVTRHIPVALRDRVTVRDQCRCTFVGADGHRCGETLGLQVDHVQPFSWGGDHSDENLRVLCAGHNRFVYGRLVHGNQAPPR